MRYAAWLYMALVIGSGAAQAQSASTVNLTGRWIATLDRFGTPIQIGFELKQEGEKLTGTFGREQIEGTNHDGAIHWISKDNQGDVDETTATFANGVIKGTNIETDANDKAHPETFSVTAERLPARSSAAPQRHEFVPTVYYRQFSALNKPVLHVAPGDTIHTTTVDAGGTDFKGVRRSLGGNPETGPFFVETAMPGDTLVVHLVRLKLNRDYAISDDGIVPRGMNPGVAVAMKDAGNGVKWHIDLEKGLASLEKPGDHMKNYTVPVHPMLGCIATAPPPSQAGPQTGDSGNFGGNMDFNEMTEGATLYLPVQTVGALLYFGDGHAAQGDGETTGDALETSMDVELTVDVIPGKSVPSPRIDSGTHLIAMGLAGSIDDALRTATANMAKWLGDVYKLGPQEIAEVFGTAAEYKISEIADRNAGVVLKISKERLATLGK